MYTHILIATDGSDVAKSGFDHGLSLANALSSKVTIVTVTEPFPLLAGATASGWIAGPDDIARYEAGQEAFAKGVLVSAKAAADRAGVKADTLHVADRWPADTIVEVAEARDCDLIVMASHGRRGLGRLILGSQTAEVLAHSKIPVLVVR
ncbi:universal stress protein UspA [Mesorhizobium sp. Root157]|uniref:universal stress protein n=1 Tax=Mesorhizobium sp. Root157 TaxID=1736477 RepID=UPI0006F884F8|nr:universal stress protein [Mesorhizobium sp. Root157]KQZ80797.1 universal stress protein UspA [Mesorhizobium sp. Root157]